MSNIGKEKEEKGSQRGSRAERSRDAAWPRLTSGAARAALGRRLRKGME